MTKRRPRIGFLTGSDAQSRRSQSGVFYFMAKALQKHCGDVTFLGPHIPVLPESEKAELALACESAAKGRRGVYDAERCHVVSQAFARHFEARIQNENLDLIFAPNAAVEIAFLQTRIPIVYVSDATIRLLNGYYENFSHLANLEEADDIERRAIRKAQLLIYRTTWAGDSAVNDYGADPARVYAIPNGANIDTPPEAAVALDRRRGLVCRLLFLAKEWKRKGGDLAYRTMVRLNEAGVKTELIVCGCVPSEKTIGDDERVVVIPFRNKDDADHRRLLGNVFRASDFLFVPTRGDCFLNVAGEASAFGLPSISTDTGGVYASVADGINGYRLPLAAREDDYAKLIETIYRDDAHYEKLVRSSREMFETRLNWDTWGLTVKGILSRHFSFDLSGPGEMAAG